MRILQALSGSGNNQATTGSRSLAGRGTIEPVSSDRVSTLRLGVLTAADVAAVSKELAAISGRAFAGPPWHRDPHEADRVVSRVALMAQGRGFKMVSAYAGDRLVGFAYGKLSYTGASPPPWEAGLVRALGPETSRLWIRNGFEVVSVVVDPEVKIKGVGSALVNALLKDLPQPTAWFGVDDRAEAPIGLARRLGFAEIAHIHMPGEDNPRLILAKRVEG